MNSKTPQKNKNLNEVKQVLEENPRGMTIQDISEEVDLNRNSVAKYLEILTISGEAEREKIGPAKVYSLSERVPLSAVLNYSDDCIAVLNTSMELVQANSKFFESFDLDEEVIGKKVKEIDIPPFRTDEAGDDSMPSFPGESIIPELQSALVGDEERTVEISFEDDSKQCHMEVDMIPTTFQNGMTGFTLIFKDITERKEAERECEMYRQRLGDLVKERTKEIKKTKERLASLINASDDSIYMVDEDCRYILVNDEMTQRLGADENNIIGSKFEEFHGKDEVEEFKEKVQKVFETGETVKHRHSWQEPERHFLRTLSPVKNTDTDEVKNVAVVCKDITSLVD
ncbi:MAG: PAS domain-containing protein [Candidatus Aenigmatarchaeota archaeon]